ETEETKKLSLLENDILIAGTGATAGITHFVGIEWHGLPFSYNAPRIRSNQLYPKFLFFTLNAKFVIRQQFRFFTGNAHILDRIGYEKPEEGEVHNLGYCEKCGSYGPIYKENKKSLCGACRY
ncbi:hypothetical protein K8R47_02765, partial [archaeon]|nr:hypothetical protein [archaeon]